MFHHLIDGKAGRFLARRKLLECREEFANVSLRRQKQIGMIQIPVPISVGSDGGLLIGIGAQILEPWNPGLYKGFAPNCQSAFAPLLSEYYFPVVVT